MCINSSRRNHKHTQQRHRDLDVRGNILLDLIDYWREVKQEIEKL